MPREAILVRAFVELADTLVDDFDVVELLTVLADRCLDVLDVEAAGIMLVGADGAPHVMASSSEAMHLVEVFEIQAEEGPCLECLVSGEPVLNVEISLPTARWPRFTPKARALGFRTVHALPMRLRGNVIGALNLFGTEPGLLRPADAEVAQSLADVATIAILQHRAALEAQVVNAQLAGALESRIAIEQAKGMVAERSDTSVDEAFHRLRRYARNHNLRLVDVARSIIDGGLSATALGPG